MENKTAIDWYFDKIKSHFEHDGDLLETATFTYAIAKQKEKQQIIDAFYNGDISIWDNDSEKYYNETYGSKGSDEIKKAEEMGLYDKIELSNPNDSIFTSSQTEISDEEIEKAIIDQDVVKQEGYCHCFLEGAKWYREQLKKK